MTVAELKLKIFREVDTLEKNRLEEIYVILNNYINGKKDIDDWDKLSEEQKHGIEESIKEIDSGKIITHEVVMAEIRKKYLNFQ